MWTFDIHFKNATIPFGNVKAYKYNKSTCTIEFFLEGETIIVEASQQMFEVIQQLAIVASKIRFTGINILDVFDMLDFRINTSKVCDEYIEKLKELEINSMKMANDFAELISFLDKEEQARFSTYDKNGNVEQAKKLLAKAKARKLDKENTH